MIMRYSELFVHFTLCLYKIVHLEIYININDILKHFHLKKETVHLLDALRSNYFLYSQNDDLH